MSWCSVTDILNVDITPGCLIAVAVWSKKQKPTMVIRTVLNTSVDSVWFRDDNGKQNRTTPDRVVVVSNLER